MLTTDEQADALGRVGISSAFTAASNRCGGGVIPKTKTRFSRLRAVAKFLADAIAEYTERPGLSGVLGQVEQLLDDSVAANEYLIPKATPTHCSTSARSTGTASKKRSRQGRPRTAAQRLRSLLSAQIAALVRLNPMRVDLVERFEKLVADYNAGSMNTEAFFQELLAFKKDAHRRGGTRGVRGTRRRTPRRLRSPHAPAPKLSAAERVQVKKVADELLAILKRNKLVLDWRKQQSTRAAVRVAVEETLDRLPEAFTRQIYAQKCDAIYQHVFDSYWDNGHSVHELAA